MFFTQLTDVPAGGATVFPFLGLSVRPQKGMALLWYNLRPNGSPDPLTLHSACPVLIGNKWSEYSLYTLTINILKNEKSIKKFNILHSNKHQIYF